MSIENPKKPEGKMKIVHIKGKDNESSKEEKEVLKLDPDRLDLSFCEEIKETTEIDEISRRSILEMLHNLLKNNPESNTEDNLETKRKYLSNLIRVYNQIYRFEADQDKKELAKEKINQAEFSLRQLLLS